MILRNDNDEYARNLSVTLKVLYIYEGDQYKKYELRLHPGEYSYQEIIQKIREVVQVERYYVKISKRTFILVDLM
jgi:hypothetical protein